jgi:cytochrome c biogenesis protein CcmG, thiol:disulfide interchange protein DsbE
VIARLLLLAAVLAPLGAAPVFTLKGLDGSTFRLAKHLGRRTIVLDFWATWCGPCTRALKTLQELHTDFPDALVLAISIDDGQSVARVDGYVRGRGFTFPVLLDPDGSALRLYNPSGSVPTTVIIDRRGEVVYSHVGYLPGDERIVAEKVKASGP